MTEKWVSAGKKYCEICKIWLTDNRTSIEFHENGSLHKNALQRKNISFRPTRPKPRERTKININRREQKSIPDERWRMPPVQVKKYEEAVVPEDVKEAKQPESKEVKELEREFVRWKNFEDDGGVWTTDDEDTDHVVMIYITTPIKRISRPYRHNNRISSFLHFRYTKDSNISEAGAVKNIYDEAEKYWATASENVDGMLGGLVQLHWPDIRFSQNFIRRLQEKNLLLKTNYALDCGAGIGRVTRNLLAPIFQKVDMVDVAENLITKSADYIGKGVYESRIGEKFVEGLQTFAPPKSRYDMIWIQWVSGHLTDNDFVSFFERCKEGLNDGGVIVLKDNLSSQETSDFNPKDHSWTRPETLIDQLFKKANLKVVSKNLQLGFPKGTYKVKMFALKPV